MKLKKISTLCTQGKRYVLYDKIDGAGKITQWLGDGKAAYPLDGLPLLNEESLCKMFDITDKQRGHIYFHHIEMLDFMNTDDTDPAETQVEEMELGIIRNGKELVPLMGQEGIIFIDRKHLSPLEDEVDMMSLFERKDSKGQRYIAVKSGLLIRAVIMPVDAVDDKFVNCLHDILRECRREMERPRSKDQEGDGPQITWTEVEE